MKLMGVVPVSIPEMVRLIAKVFFMVGDGLNCFNSRDGAIDSKGQPD